VAGKTFGGYGDGKKPSASRDAAPLIADEDDAQDLNSGPTVVDDKKVEEVLRKLRSLDKPPGPLTGITQMPGDPSDSEPTRIETQEASGVLVAQTRSDPELARLGKVMTPQQRPTAIGRSLSPDAAEQPVTVPADAGRGTMFGHDIHLPDVDVPDEVSVEISSGGVQFLPGTPLAAQAERPLPPLAAPIAPAVERFHAPFGPDSYTQLVDPPRQQAFRAVVALLGGAGLVGLIWFGANRFFAKPAAGPSAAAPATKAPPAPPAPRSPPTRSRRAPRQLPPRRRRARAPRRFLPTNRRRPRRRQPRSAHERPGVPRRRRHAAPLDRPLLRWRRRRQRSPQRRLPTRRRPRQRSRAVAGRSRASRKIRTPRCRRRSDARTPPCESGSDFAALVWYP
jgi:hypothetical protein